MDIRGVERAFDGWAGNRPGDRGVEVELADLGRAGGRARVDLDVEGVIRRFAALDVEPRVARDEVQARRDDGRIVVEEKISLERRLAGEDRADDRRRHALEPGVEVEGEPAPGVLPRDDDLAIGPDVRAGREVELRREIVERAGAVEGEPGRRQARKIDKVHEEAASRLLGIDAERELVGGGHIGHEGLELARRVQTSRGESEVEPLGRGPKRRLAGDVETRRDADKRLAKRQLLDRELLDDHPDRQFGQDRPDPACVRRRRRLGRQGSPQELHVSDRQLIDLQAPAQERKPPPDQPGLVDLHPRPVAIGKDDVADRGVGGEHAVDRADGDACRRRGERLRDEVRQHALVRLVGSRGRVNDEERGDQRRQRHALDAEKDHQKACPMLK